MILIELLHIWLQVSRCGMIYMEPHMLGWKPLLVSWLSTLPKTLNEENLELIKDLFDRMEEALLQFVRKGGFKVMCCHSCHRVYFRCGHRSKYLDTKRRTRYNESLGFQLSRPFCSAEKEMNCQF